MIVYYKHVLKFIILEIFYFQHIDRIWLKIQFDVIFVIIKHSNFA
jgi:hypothetical protein